MVQFLMKNQKVAFTTDYERLIIDAKGRVQAALDLKATPKNQKKLRAAQARLDRLVRVAQR